MQDKSIRVYWESYLSSTIMKRKMGKVVVKFSLYLVEISQLLVYKEELMIYI